MLLVLDTNEYLFTFGLLQKESCRKLLDTLSEKYLSHKLRVPRLIIEEVRRNLTDESFKEVILFWLIAVVINIIYTVAIFIVIFVVVLPLGLLAVGIGFANLIAGIIAGIIGFLIVYLVMLAISGYYTAGITSYWTLAYLELSKNKSP